MNRSEMVDILPLTEAVSDIASDIQRTSTAMRAEARHQRKICAFADSEKPKEINIRITNGTGYSSGYDFIIPAKQVGRVLDLLLEMTAENIQEKSKDLSRLKDQLSELV